MADRFNLKNIRTLLTEGFTADELREFCFYEPEFRPIFDQLSLDSGKVEIGLLLIEYADRKLLLDKLLDWAKAQNPARYEKHRPYRVDDDSVSSVTTRYYNLRHIRNLLMEAFSKQELVTLSYWEPAFKPVYDRVTADTGKAEFIDQLIEYAHQKLQLDTLLTWVKEQNPAKYEKHQPYTGDLSPVPTTRYYNLRNIWALLDEEFTREALLRFSLNEPRFRPVYDQLLPNSDKEEVIYRLINHADRTSQIESLLNWTKEHSHTAYIAHQPYFSYDTIVHSTTTTSITKRKTNPYIAGDPIDNPELFFGREELIATIMRSLPGNHIAVEGPRRSGKSSLLNEVARRLHQLDDPEFCFVPVKFNCQSATQTEFFYKLMRALLKTLREMYPILAWSPLIHQQRSETYSDIDFEDDLHNLLASLRDEVKKEIKIILLLDEGDTLNQYDLAMQGKIRTIISDNKALKMVWVGTNITQAAKDLGSPWYNLQITYPLSPLPTEEARRLIIEPAKRLGYTYQAEATERILAYSNGQPYIIQYLCHRAVEAMLVDERAAIALAGVETAISQLEAEKSAQDTASVVYQSHAQAERQLSLAETPTPYDTDPEDNPT